MNTLALKDETLLKLSQEDYPVEPGQPCTVDMFRPEDALGVARCFYTVYGDSYSIDTVYSPASLIEANATGNLYSVVARTPKGDVVGYCALFRSLACKFLYEQGQLVVLPSYRNEAIATQVVKYGLEVVAPRLPVHEVFGKAVCNHTISQKIGDECGFRETALEIDYIPEEAYKKEKSATGPVSALLMFRCCQDRPHDIYLPETYEDVLHFIYTGLPITRTFKKPDTGVAFHTKSRVQCHVFGFQKVARLNVEAIGSDFEETIATIEGQAGKTGSTIIQVYLPLGNPAVGDAVALLRAKGYFLGGALPRWFDQDGLLLQKIDSPPHFNSIRLYSERAGELLEFVRTDWEKAERR